MTRVSQRSGSSGQAFLDEARGVRQQVEHGHESFELTYWLHTGFVGCGYKQATQALAAAGYDAMAPDQRGYGDTGAPEDVDDYTQFHLVGDMVGMVAALGDEQAVIVGHDRGAPVACNAAIPNRCMRTRANWRAPSSR